MPITRRDFMQLTSAGVAALAASVGVPGPAAPSRLKAVAFDAFPIFNPAPMGARAEALYPGRGAALIEEWRLRQFEYGWLRVLSRRYTDFWHVTQDALVFAARKLKLDLGSGQFEALMNAFLELVPWPDVAPALTTLARSGLRLGFLSNFTPRMLAANLERTGLAGRFDKVLSTDQAGTFKPDARAYELGVSAFGLQREEILFVAHAGWDAAGAKSFGYPTFWVNRPGLPEEELGAPPDATGRDLTDLVQFVDRSGGAR